MTESIGHKCTYKSKTERCMLPNNHYPVTKNGQISRQRIYAALRFAPRYNDMSQLKKSGICSLAKREKIKSKHCN